MREHSGAHIVKPLAFIDTETTGTHAAARVIELAVVTYRADGFRDGEFTTLLRGDGTVGGAGAQRVHGISRTELVGAPDFRSTWERLEPILAGRILVAHNAAFDRRRIDHELGIIGARSLPPMACTMRMAYDLGYASRRRGGQPGVSARLGDLTRRLGIPVNPSHRALADTEAAAALFWHFHGNHRRAVEAHIGSFEPYRAAHLHTPPPPRPAGAVASTTDPGARCATLPNAPTPGRRWRRLGH